MAWESRKRKRGKPGRGPARAPSASQQLLGALQEMRESYVRSERRGRGKRRHIDDYWELVLDGSRAGELSQALLELTQESHRDRARLVADMARRIELPASHVDGCRGDEHVRQRARRAVAEIRAEMRRQGIPEPTHYYLAAERAETGEVDRTYEIAVKPHPEPRPKRS